MHAGRTLTFRDGRLLRDDPVSSPRDAAAQLALLEEEVVA